VEKCDTSNIKEKLLEDINKVKEEHAKDSLHMRYVNVSK
jgi:hypothetical protein